MGRRKLCMEQISNEKARVIVFEKRRKGLEKAAYELSTLCGVDVGMIVYGPATNSEPKEPKIWPRNLEVVSRLIDSYMSRPNCDSRYRAYDLSQYFKERTERMEDEIKKLREKIREAKYPKWNHKYNSFSHDKLKEFDHLLTAKIDDVRERISLMNNSRSWITGSDFLMNSSVQESAIFMPEIVQQQQFLACYDTQDNMGKLMECSRSLHLEPRFSMNPLVQETAFFMPDIIQQWQPLAYCDTQDNTRNLMQGSRNLYLEPNFSMNPLAQEIALFMPDIIQQQQPFACYDTQDNKGNSMEGSRNLFVESKFFMNNSVQESGFLMPDIVQQQQHLQYSDAQNSMENQRKMMMNDGASCSQSAYSFNQSQNNSAHISGQKWFQNCGQQTGIMGNVAIRKAEPVMSYYVPSMETMPQNGQCLLLSSAFPQMQAAQDGDYVPRKLD